MLIRGVIFDFDGTLGDTLPLCTEAFRRAAEPLAGRPFTDEEIHSTFGPSEEGSVHTLAPGRGEECLEAYLRHYEAMHGEYDAPFPGVREMLADLRAKGVRLGLVTGKGPRTCEISLRRMDLADAFTHVETGCAEGPCKPAKIRLILADWGLPPTEVVYIGDSPSDVDSARAAGIAPLGAAWAQMTDPSAIAAKGPEALFTSIGELRGWLALRT